MKTFEYNLIADWSTWLLKEVFVFWLDIHFFLMETSGNDSALGKRVVFNSYPVDTGHKLDVNKTFRRRPVRLLNVLCTSNLRPVSLITSTGPLEINSFSCDIFIKTVSFDSDLYMHLNDFHHHRYHLHCLKLWNCYLLHTYLLRYYYIYSEINTQKHPPGGVFRKSCSENMQQIYCRAIHTEVWFQ